MCHRAEQVHRHIAIEFCQVIAHQARMCYVTVAKDDQRLLLSDHICLEKETN